MTDTVSRKKRSEIMRAVKSKDSEIEIKFRKSIWKAGFRYRKSPAKYFGKPDLVLKKHKTVIFIDSCFWHGCKRHCRLPATRKKYWTQKIERNKKRDKKVNYYYKKNGWKIIRVWEHEIQKSANEAISKITKRLNNFMQKAMKPNFKEEDKIRCLLWCDRHCCLCRKNCGPDIEVAHINRNLRGEKRNAIDNAMPLCYDCHAKVGHYNIEEPRGNKYRPNELKRRREQVYEEFTRHLVPPIDFRITQILMNGDLRKFPDVGFEIRNLGTGLPVRVYLSVDIYKNNRKVYNAGGHYAKEKPWKMNPGMRVQGHFEIPEKLLKNTSRISAIVDDIEIIDEYKRPHKLLPMEWVYEISKGKEWWYDP